MWHIIVMSVLETQLKKQLSFNATIHTKLLLTLWHTDLFVRGKLAEMYVVPIFMS